MKDLIKIEEQVVYGYHFDRNQAAVIQAKSATKLAKIDENEAKQAIIQALFVAVQTIGQKLKTDEELQFITNDLYHFCASKFPNLSLEELLLSIRFGSFGEYGEDVVHISPKNVVQWIKSYLDEKRKVFTLLQKAKEKKEQQDRDEERNRQRREYWQNFAEFVADEAEAYYKSGQLSPNAWLIVRGLDKIGFLEYRNLAKEEKGKIYAEAKKQINAEMLEEANKNYLFDRIKEPNGDKAEQKAIQRSKEICLMKWFDKKPNVIESITPFSIDFNDE